MFNLFKKKESQSQWVNSPIQGRIEALDSVPDPVFAGKMVGDGFAVKPTNGMVYAPISGEVVQLFGTKHAFGIRSSEGLEVLVHVGIDTVQLKGEGFEAHVATGDQVAQGQLVLSVDLEAIEAAGKSTITPVIVTNMTEVSELVLASEMIGSDKGPTDAVLSVRMK